MRTIKTIGDIACIGLACVAVVVICAFAYYSIFNKDITIGINNIDDQVALDIIDKIENENDLTQEQIAEYKDRYFMNVNYYDNSKQNGVELAELRFDYFTTYRLQEIDYRSTGMQYVGDYQGNDIIDSGKEGSFGSHGLTTIFNSNDKYATNEEYAANYVDPAFYYYDTTNGIAWNGQNGASGSIATELKRATPFIIKIDGRPFAIQLTGSFDVDVGDVRNFFGIGWKTADKYSRHYWTYSSVFKTVLKAVKSNSVGYGDYYITVDLSEYFTIREYDTETGKFKTDNVTDIIKNYCVLKFHYDENGASQSSQSLYDIIENNRNFDLFGVMGDTTYWQERMVYNLGADDLKLRYSSVYDGYFASLSLKSQNMFNNMPRAKVNIVLDLENTDIVGFDYNAFEDFEIDTVRLIGYNQDFYLLEKCLYNSNIKTFEYSDGINFDFGVDAINNEYTEVVI